MCDSKDSSNDGRNASTLYEIRLIHGRNLSRIAQEIPITEVLPVSPDDEYRPAFSHYHEPDEEYRFNRLLELHRIMTLILYSLGKLKIYQEVLALHDRKGTLILVLDNLIDPNDTEIIVQAAGHGWLALHECEIALVYRRAGERPRGIAPRKPTPRKPSIAFVPSWDGGGFQPEGSPLFWVTKPRAYRKGA
jgi:hypothetical protein